MVFVEAVQFTQAMEEGEAIWPEGMVARPVYLAGIKTEVKFPAVHTLNGIVDVVVGDWIIKDSEGRFYPCNKREFEDTYEPVDD